MVAVLFIVFLVALAIGVPVAFSLGLASVAYMLGAHIQMINFAQYFFKGLDSFTLLCIPGFTFAGKVIALYIVEGFFVALWSMLFVIPGIIAAYRYSFAMLNLCENPELGVMEALNLSKQQTNGYKMQLFLLQLSFIGWSLLVLGIFLIYELLIAALYEYAIISFLPDSLPGVLLGTLIYSVLAAGVGVYLTPYLNLSICRFYLLATAPQVNEPPHFDSWNDNF